MADKHTVITPYLKKDEGDSWSGNDSTVTGGVDVSSKWGNVNIEQSNYKNPKYNYKNKTKSVSYNKGPVTLSWSDSGGHERKSISISKSFNLSNLFKNKKNKGGLMTKSQPINMATGGLMNKRTPYRPNDESDKEINASDGNLNREPAGISAYDVSTPESAREGLPSRLLSPNRTRFNKGGTMNKKGLLKRMGYYKGDKPIPIDIPSEEDWDDMTDDKVASDKNAVQDIFIARQIDKLENMKKLTDDSVRLAKIDEQIESLKLKMTRVRAALGGVMDENQIAEETPLALSIGGEAALNEKYDRRKDYKAYAEGDEVIADEEIIEEPLMAPVGMDTEEDIIAETDMELAAEDEIEDADSILDTSMLSEEEETVVDQAIEMFPELEAIIPKIVATEFTEDELVEGPGTGTSDSIPALLSDGEFVFTAKAVKNIGIDKLRKMMKQAEEAYDAGMVEQEDAAAMAAEEESLLV